MKKYQKNALSIDVEDYFQVSAFEPYISRLIWDNLQHRVENNTHKILDMLDDKQVKATFFTLGWIAERYPGIVNRIILDGHELACHGYEHIRVTEQTMRQFRSDAYKAKNILEQLSGREIKGYRAASYSIGANNLWALNVLQELGFKYSSSIYPVKHDLYGMPEAPRFMFEPIHNNNFKEIPITTVRLGNTNWPCGGGGFFRFYPYALSKWAINRVNKQEQESVIFYFHPWEIDTKQPRQTGLSLKTRTRHYLNIDKMKFRLNKLLTDFKWDTMENVFDINKGKIYD